MKYYAQMRFVSKLTQEERDDIFPQDYIMQDDSSIFPKLSKKDAVKKILLITLGLFILAGIILLFVFL